MIPSPDPINFGPYSCFGKLLLVPKVCKILAQCASMMTGTVCFEEKLFVMQNLGIMGTGSKYVVESAIFGIADPDLPIHYATFMGLQ